MFVSMVDNKKENTLRTLFRVRLTMEERPPARLPKKNIVLSHSGDGRSQTVKRKVPKVGRNDPCPCGSGKKYKHCCGR